MAPLSSLRHEGELGAELHDRVIAGLTALILEMEQFKREQYNRSSVQTAVAGFQQTMRSALTELREVVNGLQGAPSQLESGLVEMLRTGPLADLRARTGAATRLIASSSWPRVLTQFTALQIYRIVEQALRNIADHSEARSVKVSLRVEERDLLIEIEDDGVGLPWATKVVGQGVTGMRQRALLLGGTAELDTRPGGGTVVRVLVPNGAAYGAS